MSGKRPTGLKNVILVWVIGLTLGIGAGALTAMLLLPSEAEPPPADSTLADKLNGEGS